METLMMSVKERRRLAVLGQVESGGLSVAAAGRLLGLSERQARRVWKRYRQAGDAGLVHGLRGRAGNRRGDPAVRQRALELVEREYGGYGPTLAAERLAADHGLVVEASTLRRWMIDAGLWRARGRSAVKRQRRPRRLCFGELLQLDGSDHDWLGVGERCCLMVMIDDATSRMDARFFEAETTAAAMTMMERWAREHGLPQTVYPDRHSIYRRNDEPAQEVADRTGKRPATQFGRAMQELGVELIWARSPQAKGRVERVNRTLQDRLVKALRREGITTIESGNEYLDRTYLAEHNARFAVAAAEPTDVHVAVRADQLDATLVHRERRTVGQDHCVSFEGAVLQLQPSKHTPSLAGKWVDVERTLAGELRVRRRDRLIPHQTLDARPKPAKVRHTAAQRVAQHKPPSKPAANHQWRAPAVPRRSPGGSRSATARAAPSPPLREPRPAT
jgi:transposase